MKWVPRLGLVLLLCALAAFEALFVAERTGGRDALLAERTLRGARATELLHEELQRQFDVGEARLEALETLPLLEEDGLLWLREGVQWLPRVAGVLKVPTEGNEATVEALGKYIEGDEHALDALGDAGSLSSAVNKKGSAQDRLFRAWPWLEKKQAALLCVRAQRQASRDTELVTRCQRALAGVVVQLPAVPVEQLVLVDERWLVRARDGELRGVEVKFDATLVRVSELLARRAALEVGEVVAPVSAVAGTRALALGTPGDGGLFLGGTPTTGTPTTGTPTTGTPTTGTPTTGTPTATPTTATPTTATPTTATPTTATPTTATPTTATPTTATPTTAPIAPLALVLISPRLDAAEAALSSAFWWKSLLLALTALLGVAVVLLMRHAEARERATLALQRDFISTVSHELRTPLAAIRVLAETLERKLGAGPSGPAKDYPKRLVAAVDGLGFLVENILSFNRIESGRVEPKREPFSLSSLESMLREDIALMVERPVTLELDPALSTLGGIDADLTLLRILVLNLLRNTWKYSRREVAKFTVRGHVEGAEVVLTFADDGPGIPAEVHERVFEPFHRQPESSNVKGSGLGLALARRIAQLHHGTLRITASSAEGTTFELRLPGASGRERR